VLPATAVESVVLPVAAAESVVPPAAAAELAVPLAAAVESVVLPRACTTCYYVCVHKQKCAKFKFEMNWNYL
jgi:curli biogenesis system outer membrane secretion channel CsgG